MTVIGTVWVNLVAGDWLLKRRGGTLSNWTHFSQWRLPEYLVWGVIASGLFLFLPDNPLSALGLNTLLVLGLVYFFQGLSIMTFLLKKWAVPAPLKVFLYALLVVQAYGMIILAGLGLADVWLDFRKPRPEVDTHDD